MTDEVSIVAEQGTAPSGDIASSAIGKTLRDAREALNVSIDHAARQLHLDVRLLSALENEDFKALPGTTYAYGYLRSYAKLLKLPEENILNEFLRLTGSNENELVPEHMTFSEKNKVPSYSFSQSILIVVVLVAVVGAVAWVFLGDVIEGSMTGEAGVSTPEHSEPNSSVVPDISPVESFTEETVAAVATKTQKALPDSDAVKQVAVAQAEKPGKALQLIYEADSWTEVRDADNETLIYRMVRSGEKLELDGQAPYTILLGYAPGVSVSYKEIVFDTKPYHRDDIAYFRVGQKVAILATEE